MSVNNLDNILWTEKYRPKNLAELIVPQRIKKIFDGGVVQKYDYNSPDIAFTMYKAVVQQLRGE